MYSTVAPRYARSRFEVLGSRLEALLVQGSRLKVIQRSRLVEASSVQGSRPHFAVR